MLKKMNTRMNKIKLNYQIKVKQKANFLHISTNIDNNYYEVEKVIITQSCINLQMQSQINNNISMIPKYFVRSPHDVFIYRMATFF